MPLQRIGDNEIYYEIRGNGAPIVFLPGIGEINRTQAALERAGAEPEVVFAALCHDIGKAVSVPNHPRIAAEILRPYVSDDVYEMVRTHQDFQGRHYYQHFGAPQNLRDGFADEPWFALCEEFTDDWDQQAFDPDADIRGVLVCPMAAEGVEVIIGTKYDDQFGPVIMYGLGGIMVEILKDAKILAKLLKGLPIKVNLIFYNPHSGSDRFKRPEESDVFKFNDALIAEGLISRIRESRGKDINAACGQLKSRQV